MGIVGGDLQGVLSLDKWLRIIPAIRQAAPLYMPG
jgi:hypothetical protein